MLLQSSVASFDVSGGSQCDGSMTAEAAAFADGRRPATARRVLMVDDDLAVRLVLGRGLARHGYEVFLAGGGRDALTQLADNDAIDAVVSDIDMPVMTGVELAWTVLSRYPGVPVLLVTGRWAPSDLPESPLVELMFKPVPMAELCDRLDQLIDWAATRSDREPRAAADGDGRPDPTT